MMCSAKVFFSPLLFTFLLIEISATALIQEYKTEDGDSSIKYDYEYLEANEDDYYYDYGTGNSTDQGIDPGHVVGGIFLGGCGFFFTFPATAIFL